MNNRSLLILSIVTGLLLFYLIFVGKDSPGTDERKERSEKVVVFVRDQVERIELTTGGNQLLLAKESKGWRIEKPFADAADGTKVDRLLTELEFSRKVATLNPGQFESADQAKKEMGLDQPEIDLKVRGPEQVIRLAIGAETPRTNHYFALLETERKSEWLVVPGELRNVLSGPPNEWRSKRVFHGLTTPAIQSLSLINDRPEVLVERVGDEWKIKRPFEGATLPGSVNTYMANLLGAQIAEFLESGSEKNPEIGLSDPKLTLTVRTESGEEVLWIGADSKKDENHCYARLDSRDAVFLLKQETLDEISNLLDQVREKRVVTLPPASIDRFSFKGPALESTLVQEEGNWFFEEDGQSASNTTVNQFLTDLEKAQATGFLEPTERNEEKHGLSKPEIQIILVSGDTEIKVRISPEKEGKRVVANSSLPFHLEVPVEVIPEFPQSRVGWLDARLELPNPQSWTAMTWEVPQGKLEIRKNKDGKWFLTSEERSLDNQRLEEQILLLTNLPVDSRQLVSDSDVKPSGLKLTVSVDSAKTFLEAGLPQDGLVPLRRNGDPEGYMIREPDFRRLVVFPVDYREETTAAPDE